ncbi:MAG: nucleotide exchange factor GrpE [Alphaproteobacteria bacterium]|nr:nucleotide exchange factor GrpE [Alphaproteobacteria bacterium]
MEDIKKEEAIEETNPLQAELDALQDKYLRSVAETENIKRRSKIDSENAARIKMINLAENILPVVDASLSALKHNPNDEGIKMILNAAIAALEKSGIRQIKSVGEKLNPILHQAISTAQSDTDSGIIIEEIQTGFELDGQPLRHAMVIVSA